MKKIIYKSIFTLTIFAVGYTSLSLKEFNGTTHTCYNFVSTTINPSGECLAFDCSDCNQKRVNCLNSQSGSSKCTK